MIQQHSTNYYERKRLKLMDRDTFLGVLVGLEAGRRVGQKTLTEFYSEAGRRGINLVRYGMQGQPATVAAESVGPSLTRRALGTLARRSPYIAAGAGIAEAVRRSPDLVEDVIDQWEGAQKAVGARAITRKRSPSKFNKAIKVGMEVVKKSKSFGKPGSFSNSKKAFATVTKTVSGLKKGRKTPKTGIRRKIARAVRRYI